MLNDQFSHHHLFKAIRKVLTKRSVPSSRPAQCNSAVEAKVQQTASNSLMPQPFPICNPVSEKKVPQKTSRNSQPQPFAARKPRFQKPYFGAGNWTRADGGIRVWQAKLYVLTSFLWTIVPSIAFIYRHQSDFRLIMKALIELIIVGKITLQAAIVVRYRPVLEQIYAELQSTLDECHKDTRYKVQVVLRDLQSFSSLLVKGYLGFEIFGCLVYSVLPAVTTIVKYMTTGIVPPLAAPLEADFIFVDYTSNFWIWLLVAVISLILMIANVITAVVQDSLYWCLVHYVSSLFKIISMEVERLDEFHQDDQQFERELARIVSMQHVAYSSATGLKSALSGLLLLLYGGCIVVLCMTMMVLTIASEDQQLLLKMGVILYYILFQIFSYSMLGTELMATSASVAEAVYNSRWHLRSAVERRNLLFVLIRSQRMATLTAAEFFSISRATFAMTIRSAFSYFTVLRQFYGQQNRSTAVSYSEL
ncbi:uncharacterized protein LOC129717303 [Wyeomyia smithii]|uniref:uncharacterized protein LOC129717303 n=1 Tax=Wyeomyia smithii TaxID=174621 RepID=UPI002467C39D|nr:uncharacterized protein LOC129717303 [Wyeomyia smithii]